MKCRRVIVALLVLGLPVAAASRSDVAQGTARAAQDFDYDASWVYATSQTAQAFQRRGGANLIAARRRIDELEARLAQATIRLASARGQRRRLEREVGALRAEIARERIEFTRRLAERDALYAEQLESLVTAGEKLMSTPRGRAALELYLKGGPGAHAAADAVLAEVQAARMLVRERRSKEELSADLRERVALALDALDKGATKRDVVLKLEEQLVEVGVPRAWDLIMLARSYEDVGRPRDAAAAATKAVAVARTPIERSAALNQLGLILKEDGDFTGAEGHFTASLEIMQSAIRGKAPGSREFTDLAIVLILAGDSAQQRRDHAKAVMLYREALRIVRAQLATPSPMDDDRRNESTSLMRLGDIHYVTKGCAAALPFYRQGMESRQNYAATAYDSLNAKRSVMIGFGAVGSTELECGDKDKALKMLGKGVELSQELATAQPSSSAAKRDYSVSLGQLARGLAAVGDPAVVATLEKALEIDRQLLTANPNSFQALNDIADDLAILAELKAPGHSWSKVAAHYDAIRALRVEPASPEQEARARRLAREESDR